MTVLQDLLTDSTGEDFLVGGGEMGARTRYFDWATTPLGSPVGWPQSLKTAVRILLTSQHPMFIWWGPELIQFYNDACRHRRSLRRPPALLCNQVTGSVEQRYVDFVYQPIIEAPPTREGFGTRLLNKALATQARANVNLDFAPEGFRATIVLPLDG